MFTKKKEFNSQVKQVHYYSMQCTGGFPAMIEEDIYLNAAAYMYLPPANEVCEGYVFTPVCQSFCSQGEGSTWAGSPPAGTPSWQVHPTGRYTPLEQCMLGDTGNRRAVRILLECILVLVTKPYTRRAVLILHLFTLHKPKAEVLENIRYETMWHKILGYESQCNLNFQT